MKAKQIYQCLGDENIKLLLEKLVAIKILESCKMNVLVAAV